MRPTRSRLLTAMGMSACLVALLLASLGSVIEFAIDFSMTGSERREPLVVQFREDNGELHSEPAVANEITQLLPVEQLNSGEIPEIQEATNSADSPAPPTDSEPVTDWHAIIDEVATESVDEYFRRKESQASMWRKTYSVMFEPTHELVAKDDEPIVADIRFKYRSRVVGLGINIGSCFIGIPIAGVPVEQRSVAITVFVCGEES